MASNAKEKQRKGESKRSRGSREKKEGNEEQRKEEGEKRRDSWQGSSPALVITQWLNQLTPLDAGRGRLASPCHARHATPRHAHTHSVLAKSWWPARLVVRLVGLVALVALVAPPASSAPSSSSAASKQKVKLNYFCNMQHATKMATMSALLLLSLCSASVLQPD